MVCRRLGLQRLRRNHVSSCSLRHCRFLGLVQVRHTLECCVITCLMLEQLGFELFLPVLGSLLRRPKRGSVGGTVPLHRCNKSRMCCTRLVLHLFHLCCVSSTIRIDLLPQS